MIATLPREVRHGLRRLLNERWFSILAVVALGLGLGLNTTVFTLVYAVLFRDLPFADPDRLIHFNATNQPRGREKEQVSYPDFRDWRDQSKTVEAMAAYQYSEVNLADRTAPPERYPAARVTWNTFSTLGIRPVLGRDFTAEDEKPNPMPPVLIGYRIWENRYGRDPGIAGRDIRVNDKPATVIGVMPKDMRFPQTQDFWTPLVPDAQMEQRDRRSLRVFGKLREGRSLTDARAEIGIIAQRLEQAYPKENKGIGAYARTYNDEFNGGNIQTMFYCMLGAVGFVLLIVCANLTNLLMARTLARSREMSIRAAMGASRWDTIRQVLVESVLLGVAGGLLGLGVASIGVDLFDKATQDVGKPYWIVFRMDWLPFLYMAAVCVGSGVIFGLAPALRSSRLDVNRVLKEGERGGSSRAVHYFTGAMVAGQLAAALVLLVGAGLIMRSMLKMYEMTSGIPGNGVAVMRVGLSDAKYPKPEDRQRFADRLAEKIAALPGVSASALTTDLPYFGAASRRFEIEGKPAVEEDKLPTSDVISSTSGYFGVIGRSPVRGRALDDQDGLPGRQNILVNERFAAKYWPGEEAIGKRIRVRRGGAGASEEPWFTVVGVMPDIKQNSIQRAEIDPLMYFPARQNPMGGFWAMARSDRAAQVASAMRQQVQEIDPGLAVASAGTLEAQYERQIWAFKVFGTVFSTFGVFAVVLAGLGLYAVVSYSVSQRTREIGIRMALGATRESILTWVLRRGAMQLAVGVAVGLGGAFAVTRLLSGVLAQISPTDPVTFAGVTVALLGVGVGAAVIPARRAARVDPMVALRYE